MSCTRKEIVAQAQKWVGLKESDGSHKKIIDIFNTLADTPEGLPRGYKLKYTDAWCAGTTSALAIVCKATDIIPVECSCAKLIEQAKKKGIWKEADNYVPEPGDLMVYDWQDNGKGDNKGDPDHIGIVEKISGKTITIIEGNYFNAVKRRQMTVNGKYIRGYIAPKYDADTVKVSVTALQLSKGDEGDAVKALQILLIGYGYDLGIWGADSDFGSATEKAVREFQAENDLGVDGVVGPKTWAKLLGV